MGHYVINGIRQPEPDQPVRASTTIDTTAIYLEEIARITGPDGILPWQVAAHGAANIADDVAVLLRERGQSRYSEAQWRSACREVLRRLVDNLGELDDRSPNVARMDLHRRAEAILGRRNYSTDEYLLAAEQAQAELEPDEDAQAVYTGSDTGDELHLTAVAILRERGNWHHSAEEYADALEEAAGLLSISLSGRSSAR